MRPAPPRSCGRPWSPTWKRRSRHFSRSPAASRIELPARVGRGRRRARPLFDHRARARPRLAHQRPQGRDQPRRPPRTRRLRRLRASRRSPPCAPDRRKPDRTCPDQLPPMAAGVFGYLGYDMVRLMEDLPRRQARSDRPARRGPGAPDRWSIVFDAVKDEITVVTPVWPDTGVAADAALAQRGRAPDRGGRQPRPAARQGAGDGHRRARSTCRRPPTRRRRLSGDGRARPRNTSPPATSSRSCCRSASRRRSRCRPSRSIARCGASTRRRSCSSSTSAASPSSARARKSWCACATARSPSGRSPARVRAARRRTRTRRWRTNCSPIRRSAPST